MTKIDFYVLQETTREARWLFACKLIEKIRRLGHEVLVALDSEEAAHEFDVLLWAFKPESFVPHQILDINRKAPVEIAFTSEIGNHHNDVLVNLSDSVPAYFSRFQRLSEIVVQEQHILQHTRQHFSFYKERGYFIETRKIGDTHGQ
jgi:DNA polymerase III subunit chi